MKGQESRDEIRLKVENTEFLKEKFDYDPRGFLVRKDDGGSRHKTGSKVGYTDVRSNSNRANLFGKMFESRRLIWIWHGNEIPKDHVVYSLGGEKFDDRIENLSIKPQKARVDRDKSIEKNADALRVIFDYNPESGVLCWKSPKKNNKIGQAITCKQVTISGAQYIVARICFVIHHGRPIGEGLIVDHIDGNHHNHRAENLRESSVQANNRNRSRIKTKPDGLPKGVYIKKSINKFCASIRIDGKLKHLGYFDDAEKAGNAYSEAAKLYFGEFACSNR